MFNIQPNQIKKQNNRSHKNDKQNHKYQQHHKRMRNT